MQRDTFSIPLRKTAEGELIETRPLHVEEWLDTLPYIDFHRTCHLLVEACKLTNQQSIKPSVRLELIQLYHRPYLYYLESQLRTGARHTLQTIESMQGQIHLLKHLAVALGHACKITLAEELDRKTMWRQSKPPIPVMLMELQFLSQALIFSYMEYSTTPKGVWQEINFIYGFAESLGAGNSTVMPPGGKNTGSASTIANCYKRIMLTSLVDPHSLPFGAIWEIFDQLDDWTGLVNLGKMKPLSQPTGSFVIDLKGDTAPVPYSKYNIALAGEKHRLLETTMLTPLLQKHIAALNAKQHPDENLKLSSYHARTILTQMSKAYGLAPKRYSPRTAKTGSLELARGMNAIYYFVNNRQEFSAPDRQVDEQIDIDDNVTGYGPGEKEYTLEQWRLIDQGPGGYALETDIKSSQALRVGDLLGICSPLTSADSIIWELGVIRWLMVDQYTRYRAGIQKLAARIQPAAIRTVDGNATDHPFRRALVPAAAATSGYNSIITDKGLFAPGRTLEISIDARIIKSVADSLLETMINHEHFNIKHLPS